MKRVVLFFTILILLITVTGILSWSFKTTIIANTLQKHLKVPVQISNVALTRDSIGIQHFYIGSVPQARNPLSFQCQSIEILTNITKLSTPPLTIQSLEMDNLTIGLEYFNDGSTNWSYILASSNKNQPADSFIINSLILKNITVIITKANGAVTQYPMIPQIVLSDVNSANEPISEIEKMIFKIILNNVMKKFNLFINPQQSPILNPIENFPKW